MNALALDNDIDIAGERYQAPPRPVTEDGRPIYRVPEGNLEALQAKVDRMNRRAAKLGMSPLVLAVVGEEFEVVERRRGGVDYTGNDFELDESAARPGDARVWFERVRIVLVTLTGECPRVNGWAMAATIQHEDGGNILRTVPGFEAVLPLRFREVTRACEHCGMDRQRNDTYVLQRVIEAGLGGAEEWKQVGRNCLADFLRSTNAAGLAEWAEVLADLDGHFGCFEDEEFAGGGRGERYVGALAYLAQVACCIRADGWLSRGKAKEMFGVTATADDAMGLMDQKTWDKLDAAAKAKYTPNEADGARAAAAIAWAQALPADVGNDYLWNIRVVSARDYVGRREAGLMASIVAAYDRHLERETERRAREAEGPSEYFGTKGERGYFHLLVTGTRELQSDYGPTTLVMLRDRAGNRAKWFATGTPGLAIGTEYWLKATVKGHEEYKGVKGTVLTRAAVVDADEVAAAADKELRKKARAEKKAAKAVAA